MRIVWKIKLIWKVFLFLFCVFWCYFVLTSGVWGDFLEKKKFLYKNRRFIGNFVDFLWLLLSFIRFLYSMSFLVHQFSLFLKDFLSLFSLFSLFFLIFSFFCQFSPLLINFLSFKDFLSLSLSFLDFSKLSSLLIIFFSMNSIIQTT